MGLTLLISHGLTLLSDDGSFTVDGQISTEVATDKDTDEFIHVSIWLFAFNIGYVFDAERRTWKLIDRHGRIEQYLWYQGNSDTEPRWKLVNIRAPINPENN